MLVCAAIGADVLTACGGAPSKAASSSLTSHQVRPTTTAPARGKKVLVDILHATKIIDGYRVTAVPTRRYADYSWHDVGAPVTYIVPDSLVGEAASSLIGIADLTVRDGKVVALEILGG